MVSARVEPITFYLAIRIESLTHDSDVLNKKQVLLDKLIDLSNDGQLQCQQEIRSGTETAWYLFNKGRPIRT